MRVQKLVSAVLFATLGAVSASASAQAWPTRPVTLVVPFAPGGSTDLVARALQPGLEAVWKQPMVVENRPGAGGMVGAADVARKDPDGYTLLFQASGVKIAPIFAKSVPYDPADLRPIVGVASAYYVVIGSTKIPAKNFKELLAYAKQNQSQKLRIATVPYTPVDLEVHRIVQKSGLPPLEFIGYNGAAAVVQAVQRGEVELGLTGSSSALQAIKSGQITALASTFDKRTQELPDSPTLKEQGVDLTNGYTFGLWVHARTPQAIVDRIIEGAATAGNSPDVIKRLTQLSFLAPDHRGYEKEQNREAAELFEVARRVGVKPQ
jgi:tripartite-type tricarboxylate transporter receptor subunit TctC